MYFKMQYNFLKCLILIISLTSNALAKGPRVKCEPIWVPSGDGRVHENALECSEGNMEFIARVYHEAATVWLAGRIIPASGKAFIPYAGDVLEFDQYQVLVLPEHCEFEWLESDVIPEHAIYVHSDSNFLIGRTSYDDPSSYSYCGTIDVQNNALSIVDIDVEFQTKNKYEFFYSVYPEIDAELTFFRIGVTPVNSDVNYKELVGQDKLTITSKDLVTNHKLTHSKTFTEEFHFSEDVSEWMGIRELSINFNPFLSTKGLQVHTLVKEDDTLLSFQVQRLIESETIIEQTRGPGTNLPPSLVEICTVANLIEDVEYPFTATMKFKSSKLSNSQIEQLLLALGRTASVTTTFQGVLKGRFVLNIEMFIEDPDPIGSCSQRLIP